MSSIIQGGLRTLAALWTLLAAAAAAPAGTLQGTASIRERVALPPDAVFEAQLQDIARADAPARVLGRARLEPAGQPPFRFEIAYDDGALRLGGRYAVRATVTHRGQLLFTTDRIHPVLDGRDAPVHLLLVSARRGPAAASPADGLGPLPASFAGELPSAGPAVHWQLDLFPDGRYQLRQTHAGRPEPNAFDDIGRWSRERGGGRLVLRGGREAPIFLQPADDGATLRKLDLEGRPIESFHPDRLHRQPQFAPIEPRLLLAGMFVHMADAASMVLCADLRTLPVAMEAGYPALEAAYRQAGRPAGERVRVSVEGRLVQRPSMEPGQPPRTTLVVERLVGVWPGQRCPRPAG